MLVQKPLRSDRANKRSIIGNSPSCAGAMLAEHIICTNRRQN